MTNTLKKKGKMQNIRYVSKIEIEKLFAGGAMFTLSDLENLMGSNAMREKMLTIIKQDGNIERVKSTLLGRNNQFIYKLKSEELNLERLIQNASVALGAYFLREKIGLLVGQMIPVSDKDTDTIYRGIIALGNDEKFSYYQDIRLSFVTAQMLDVNHLKSQGDGSTRVLIIEDSFTFNTILRIFKNDVKSFEHQVWIILQKNKDMALKSTNNEAKIIANGQEVSTKKGYYEAFSGSNVVLKMKDNVYRDINLDFEKAKSNSARFLENMNNGKRKKLIENGGVCNE